MHTIVWLMLAMAADAADAADADDADESAVVVVVNSTPDPADVDVPLSAQRELRRDPETVAIVKSASERGARGKAAVTSRAAAAREVARIDKESARRDELAVLAAIGGSGGALLGWTVGIAGMLAASRYVTLADAWGAAIIAVVALVPPLALSSAGAYFGVSEADEDVAVGAALGAGIGAIIPLGVGTTAILMESSRRDGAAGTLFAGTVLSTSLAAAAGAAFGAMIWSHAE